jgi:hypothetical protein
VLPEGAVCVTRGSPWGNPFRVEVILARGEADGKLAARDLAVEKFRRCRCRRGGRYDREWMLGHLHELAGKSLACWCPLPAEGEPDICHGRVLLELANG